MRNLTKVATQVGVLFALMGVGAACRWFRLVDDGAMKGMVNVPILIVTPCLVVDVFQRPFERAALGALAVHVAAVVAARGATGSATTVKCHTNKR